MKEKFNAQNANGQQNFDEQEAQNFDGQQAPTDDDDETLGKKQSATFGRKNSKKQAPTDDEELPSGDDDEIPTFGKKQPATFGGKQSQNMWGNDKFSGEDIFNDNYSEFGATSQLSGIVYDRKANISFNFGEQNKFGSFMQNNIISTTFGGQSGQMNATTSRNSSRMR